MNAIVAEWIEKAEGDFNSAQRELRARRKPNFDAACFHSQQCAEKYFKAFLVSRRVEPPLTHNLFELHRLCLKHDGTFEMIQPSVEALNVFAVVVRYPGMSAKKEDARFAVRAMFQVRDLVRPKIK
ncbi:MAG: HEPN domain-containing protein [Chloroflexi bacterium]|nr:HEPN domain-containing protein [Chloroflexota bacterium]